MTRRMSARVRNDDRRDRDVLIVAVFVVALSVVMFTLGFALASLMRW